VPFIIRRHFVSVIVDIKVGKGGRLLELRLTKMQYVNGLSDFDTSITQSSFKVLFRNTNHVTDQLNNFNLALDWSLLCILPARQSYIRQYGKMASGSEKAFCVSVTVCECRAC
jgi:hypothetical protein